MLLPTTEMSHYRPNTDGKWPPPGSTDVIHRNFPNPLQSFDDTAKKKGAIPLLMARAPSLPLALTTANKKDPKMTDYGFNDLHFSKDDENHFSVPDSSPNKPFNLLTINPVNVDEDPTPNDYVVPNDQHLQVFFDRWVPPDDEGDHSGGSSY
jgi:hypothetical protein